MYAPARPTSPLNELRRRNILPFTLIRSHPSELAGFARDISDGSYSNIVPTALKLPPIKHSGGSGRNEGPL
jgi:hypothetical protein